MTNLEEFTVSVESELVTAKSPNYRPPSWPPPRDWPVVIDKNGAVVSRWGDPTWNLTPWAGTPKFLNFGDGDDRKKFWAAPLDAENADLMRMITTLLIWGPNAMRTVSSIFTNFYSIRPIVALCCSNGISASSLMRFPKVFEQVPEIIKPSSYDATIMMLHRLYDARDLLGFTIVDSGGLRRLVVRLLAELTHSV